MNLPQTAWLLLALAACQSPTAKVYQSLEASTDLFAVNPSDIAVLPVEDATRDRAVERVCPLIREEIARDLVERRYSPLSEAAVDRVLKAEAARPATASVVDAAWLSGVAAKLGEAAALAVRITMWDQSSLMSDGYVRFSADVALVSPKSQNPLWSGVLKGEVKAGGTGPAPLDRAAREAAAASEFAHELISLLPRRRI